VACTESVRRPLRNNSQIRLAPSTLIGEPKIPAAWYNCDTGLRTTKLRLFTEGITKLETVSLPKFLIYNHG
jgi:hypothetical protein